MGPPDWQDYEFLAVGLATARSRYCVPPPSNSGLAAQCEQWAAEQAALEEIRGGRNDCG